MAIARLVDLRCTVCQHVDSDVYCQSGAEPVCTACGSATATYWGNTHSARKADLFTPLDFEGVHYGTREEWNARIKEFSDNVGGWEVDVQSVSRHERRARSDDALHRHYLTLKKAGYSEADYRERKQELRDRKGARR